MKRSQSVPINIMKCVPNKTKLELLSQVLDVNTIFKNMNIDYVEHPREQLRLAIHALVIENQINVAKYIKTNHNHGNQLNFLNETLKKFSDKKFIEKIDIIVYKENQGPIFSFFLQQYLSKLKTTFNVIDLYDRRKVKHKIEVFNGQLNMWQNYHNALLNGVQFEIDQKFINDCSKFCEVAEIFPKETEIKKIQITPYNLFGLVMKGKESGHLNDKFGSLIGTLRMGKSINNKIENQKYIKRLSFKDQYGNLIHDLLTTDPNGVLNFNQFQNRKIQFEKEVKIVQNCDNILYEEYPEYEFKVRITSDINHDKIKQKVKKGINDYQRFLKQADIHIRTNNNLDYFETVFLQLHGGGFIGGDSKGHQSQSNQLVKFYPVISLDYRLAPKNPYPCALNDTYRAYKQLLSDQAFNLLGYIPKRVIIVGDSAGGNLAGNLMNMLIKRNEHHEVAGIYLIWPALNINSFHFNRQFLYCFKDKMLNFNSLRQMQNCQLGFDSAEDHSQYMSDNQVNPVEATDETLKKQPPLQVIAGTYDFLTVDTLNFCRRLHNLDVPVKFDLIKDMNHCFLLLIQFFKEIGACQKNLTQGMEFINKYSNPVSRSRSRSNAILMCRSSPGQQQEDDV